MLAKAAKVPETALRLLYSVWWLSLIHQVVTLELYSNLAIVPNMDYTTGMTKKLQTFHLRLPSDLHEQLKVQVKKENRKSLNNLIETILTRYVETVTRAEMINRDY
jgi:hypothetical protein